MDDSEKPFSCEMPTKSSSPSKDCEKNSNECLFKLPTEKHVKKRKRSLSHDSHQEHRCKKHKRKHKKKCKKRHKKNKEIKKLKLDNKQGENSDIKAADTTDQNDKLEVYGPKIPDEIANKAKAMAPMSKEKWEEKNNTIRRIYDEETGRHRLVRGDGEIIEEIVTRKRHCEINKQATFSSGAYFQAKMSDTGLDGDLPSP